MFVSKLFTDNLDFHSKLPFYCHFTAILKCLYITLPIKSLYSSLEMFVFKLFTDNLDFHSKLPFYCHFTAILNVYHFKCFKWLSLVKVFSIIRRRTKKPPFRAISYKLYLNQSWHSQQSLDSLRRARSTKTGARWHPGLPFSLKPLLEVNQAFN